MIAVLPDESSAFEAYRLLQCHGISPEHLALVGKGYSSPDSVGLFNPTHTTWRYAKRGMFWLGIISTAMGIILYLIFSIKLPNLDWYQALLTIASTSGLIGIVIGGVIGTLYGWFFKSSLSISCRHLPKIEIHFTALCWRYCTRIECGLANTLCSELLASIS